MKESVSKDNFLVKLSSFFFTRWRLTLIAWLILCFGAFGVYNQVIQREGFPPVQFPISIISGTYFVDDVEQVDQDITSHLTAILADAEIVKETQATSTDNFFNLIVFFEDEVKAEEGAQQLKKLISQSDLLPSDLEINYIPVNPISFLDEFDILLSVYNQQGTSIEDLQEVSQSIADQLEPDNELELAKPLFLLETAFNPASGKNETRQISFNELGLADEGGLAFHPALTVGLKRTAISELDVIEFSEHVEQLLSELDPDQLEGGFEVQITADFADTINYQISSLENNLFSGLIAVMVVSLILISWRASIITALFMASVVLISILALYLAGLTLNTISLFALILSLGLFVDDATIIVESIEANRHRIKSSLAVIKESIGRVGMASLAGTLTTILVFVPLLFVTGFLGEFVQIIPITIIIALAASLILSLILIPLLSRFLLLRNRKISWLTKVNPISKCEAWTAKFLANKIRLLKSKSSWRNRYWAVLMILLSLIMIIGSFDFARRLSFDIFPRGKDSNQLVIQASFPNNFSLTHAEETADLMNQLLIETIGDNVVQVVYTNANKRQTETIIELVSYKDREVTAPQLIEQLQETFDKNLSPDIQTALSQEGPGGPANDFPFSLQIFEDDHERALELAANINQYLDQTTIKRLNGSTFRVTETRLPDANTRIRINGRLAYILSANFDADDTSATLQATENYVKERFDKTYLTQAGYKTDALGFDFGQESDNADAFASLSIVFPIILIFMFGLLALQFRSWLQPLLILLAIPFTFLGVFAGLYYTNNSISFFSRLGLIGLVGIAVNNTILLADYANQEQKRGQRVIEAVAVATEKRFRPLLTTSLTTVVALLPLALSDPFWESLSYTIIFGLLSSTLLVILAFPYYYLLAEWLRCKVSRNRKF